MIASRLPVGTPNACLLLPAASPLTSESIAAALDGVAGTTARFRPLPLAADRFLGAISPLARPAERAAATGLIERHEAHVDIALRPMPGNADALDQLRRAAAALTDIVTPLGLFWGPTHRLHHGPALKPMLHMEAPLSLYLAPVLDSFGQRRLPVLRLAGSRMLLGFDLGLRLADIGRDDAIAVGFTFARATLADSAVVSGTRFRHAGRSFHVVSGAGTHVVVLVPDPVEIPIPQAAVLSAPATVAAL